ncbi:zinc finger protein SNAI3 [Amia ocellicauda]|uniref:zinc finger protein SNAI3 n=1 Tax=Amia ocellicauda TaxID=2972642 RepID=UPI003463FB47
MPRSFLVKKHLTYKKPNYGQLESQKKEGESSSYPLEDSMIAHISQPECLSPATCEQSLGMWACRPLIAGTTQTSSFDEADISPIPLTDTRPQYTEASQNSLVQQTELAMKLATATHRDAFSDLETSAFKLSTDSRLLKENSCLSGIHLGLAPSTQEKFECFDCHKAYYTFSGLAKHRQLHCEWQCHKYFNCKYCDKEYVSLGALKMHIRTHTLPCVCKLCGKAFSRPWLLQGHIRTHTGEKPFSCPHCSRAFADRSNLRAHLQTHSDVKKYQCKRCSKTFSRISLLSKHEEAGCCPLS